MFLLNCTKSTSLKYQEMKFTIQNVPIKLLGSVASARADGIIYNTKCSY